MYKMQASRFLRRSRITKAIALSFVATSMLVMASVALNSTVQAADLVNVQVSNNKNRFFVGSEAVLYVPVDVVYDTLMDFDNYERFSSVYQDARWLIRNPDDSGEIYTLTSGCVLFFCKSFERTESVEAVRPKSILTVVDSERSQGIVGISNWRLEVDGQNNTRLFFELEFAPNFWVPPVIGPYFIKRMLRKNGSEALQRIETLALERQNSAPQAASDERGELISIPDNIMKDVADVDTPKTTDSVTNNSNNTQPTNTAVPAPTP